MLCPSRLVTRGSLLVLLASCDPDVTVNPTGGGSTGAISPAPIGGSPVGGAPITGGAATEGGANPVGGMGGGGDPQGGGGEAPLPCSEMVAAPAPFEQLFGFTSSEDFVFDQYGNYVGIDSNGNLVRTTKDGFTSLWIPSIGSGSMAGMVALPDGSVVICDVGNGSLQRAYPNGVVQTILGGLQYPNGIDMGPDGYIYVAENGDDQVRRVHPDNGQWTIAAEGMIGPNGVAFSDDPLVFYVGSCPGLHMSKKDHAKTGSHGSQGTPGKLYRDAQEKLLSKKKWADAIAMDVKDVSKKFPGKYKKSLREMIDYARSQDLITDAQKRKLKGMCK